MNKQTQALAQELVDYATSLRSASMAIQLEGRNPPVSFLRFADLCERAAIALKCFGFDQHASIHIDFAQIGTAGPFAVENGRVSLPDVTMVDLVQRLKPTINAQVQADARDAERYRWLRSRDLETVNTGGVFAGVTPDNIVLNGSDLDAEVDAAIAAAKGEL